MGNADLPPPLQGTTFTTAEARGLGVGRGRLRGRDLRHPHHGVHTLDEAGADVLARAAQLLPVLSEDDWFSHLTAARLWGLPLPRPMSADEPLHVSRLGRRLGVRRADVVGWVRADDAGRMLRLGLPVLDPAETWCTLALRGAVWPGRTLSHEDLVAAADAVLSGIRVRGGRAEPLATRAQLQAAVHRRGSGRGVRALRLALEDARTPVDSPYETRLRLQLARHGLPEPVLQVPVATSGGNFEADLGWPDRRVLVDYQGDGHRTSREQWLRDLTRAQLIHDAGYQLFLVGRADIVPDAAALAARLRRALETSRTHH